MVLITIVNGVYKPTNITGGAHIVGWFRTRNYRGYIVIWLFFRALLRSASSCRILFAKVVLQNGFLCPMLEAGYMYNIYIYIYVYI
jgi:hypothetical protein